MVAFLAHVIYILLTLIYIISTLIPEPIIPGHLRVLEDMLLDFWLFTSLSEVVTVPRVPL